MGVEHGGNVVYLAEHLGYPIEECLDFSANINPLGLSPVLKQAISASLESLEHYPDVTYRRARSLLAHHHGCDMEAIGVWNGAIEAFYELARLLRPRTVLLLSPTFMEYEQAFSRVDASVEYCHLSSPHYCIDMAALLEKAEDLQQGDVVLLCNPNNPTGSLVTAQNLLVLTKALATKKIMLIVDEAFMDFVEQEDRYSMIPYVSKYPNLIIVRSLTKFYAIPGLRLGYSVSTHMGYQKHLSQELMPWRVNALAEAAVPALLSDQAFQQQTKRWLVTEREFLYTSLVVFADLEVVRPSVNFIFFRYKGDLDLRQELWKYKIFIRSCSNYNSLNHQHYRVAVRSRQENQSLIEALSHILEEDGHD